MKGGAVLVLAAGEEGIDVALAGKGERHRLVRGKADLLPAVMALVGDAVPAGIVVVGSAGRFSESRSVATVGNALAFAWRVPIAWIPQPVAGKDAHARLTKLLTTHRGYVQPHYSGKPNITKPKGRTGVRA